MGQYRYVFSAYPAVDFTILFEALVGPVTKNWANSSVAWLLFHFKSTFWTPPSSRLACAPVFPNSVNCVYNAKTWCRWALFEFFKHLIKFRQYKLNDEPKNYGVIWNSSEDINRSILTNELIFSLLDHWTTKKHQLMPFGRNFSRRRIPGVLILNQKTWVSTRSKREVLLE